MLIDGAHLTATIPVLYHAYGYYKNKEDCQMDGEDKKDCRNNAEECISDCGANEYYSNDSVKYHGYLVNYLQDTVLDVKRDQNHGGNLSIKSMPTVSLTSRSRGSMLLPKTTPSPFTAAVRDVAAGVSDLAVGLIWMTRERLAMVPFTTPVRIQELKLWVKQPTVKRTDWLAVFKPFSDDLWCVILCAIVVVGCLKIWFAEEGGTYAVWSGLFRGDEWKAMGCKQRALAFVGTGLDAVYQSFMDFTAGGPYESMGVSVPDKILNVGWAFLILVILTTYTASLAVFLLIPQVGDYHKTIEDAIAAEAKICVHTALKGEIEGRWGSAGLPGYDKDTSFVYGATIENLKDSYKNGECAAIAWDEDYTRLDEGTVKFFCEHSLVNNGQTVLSVASGFPARAEVVGGISYLIEAAKEIGNTVEAATENAELMLSRHIVIQSNGILADYTQELSAEANTIECKLHISDVLSDVPDETAALSVEHMFVPVVALATCIVASMIARIYELCTVARTPTAPAAAAAVAAAAKDTHEVGGPIRSSRRVSSHLGSSREMHELASVRQKANVNTAQRETHIVEMLEQLSARQSEQQRMLEDLVHAGTLAPPGRSDRNPASARSELLTVAASLRHEHAGSGDAINTLLDQAVAHATRPSLRLPPERPDAMLSPDATRV
jgi:hypothetical protein